MSAATCPHGSIWCHDCDRASDIVAVGMCPGCQERKPLAAHGAACSACVSSERWVERTFTVHLDVGTYGSEPDDEEIAYVLRMGGINAEAIEGVRSDDQ